MIYILLFFITNLFAWDQKSWNDCLNKNSKICGFKKLPSNGNFTEQQKKIFICRLKIINKCNKQFPPNK